MRLEVLIAFDYFKTGQVIDLDDGVANVRIARGFCKAIDNVKSVDAPPRDKMIHQVARKKGVTVGA